MLAITIQCEVPQERTITVRLPDQVEPGTHELVLVFNQSTSVQAVPGHLQDLMQLSGAVPAFATVDGVVWQRSLRDEWL
ncbi:MAG: hypothetical protein H7836_03400 [Magnetococcus sp. YQC-3]